MDDVHQAVIASPLHHLNIPPGMCLNDTHTHTPDNVDQSTDTQRVRLYPCVHQYNHLNKHWNTLEPQFKNLIQV